jgi:hypothetical protein
MRLTFPVDPDGDLGSFISALTLPCLEELYMAGCPASPQTILEFFRRSFGHSTHPSLKRLSLHDLVYPSLSADTLRLVPHLEHFAADLGAVQDILRQISGINEDGVPLLPELRILVINWDECASIEVVVGAFAALTSSRLKRTIPDGDPSSNHSARTLTDISLTCSPGVSPFLVQRYLNNWCGHDRVKRYDKWIGILNIRLPAVTMKGTGRRIAAEVDKVLTGIENLGLQEMNDIYVSCSSNLIVVACH